MALFQLLKALNIEETLYGKSCFTTTTTLLNISAVYSRMGQHETALKYSRSALDMLQSIPLESRDTKYFTNVVIAYYNIAAECEHLKGSHETEALQNYGLALRTANEKLGPAHSLSKSVSLTFTKARHSIALESTASRSNMRLQSKRNSAVAHPPSKSLSKSISSNNYAGRNESSWIGKYDNSYMNQEIIRSNKYNFYYGEFAKSIRGRRNSAPKRNVSLRLGNSLKLSGCNTTTAAGIDWQHSGGKANEQAAVNAPVVYRLADSRVLQRRRTRAPLIRMRTAGPH